MMRRHPQPRERTRTESKRKAEKQKKAKIQALLAAAKSGQAFQTVPPIPAPFGAQKRGKALGKGAGKVTGKRSIPQAELDRLKQQKTTNNSGLQICRWYNSSLSCQAGTSCKFAHECAQCGAAHPFHGNH